jgi:Tektin family.
MLYFKQNHSFSFMCLFIFRLLRSANYYLGKDIGDKFSALRIDDHCSSLNNQSHQIYYAPTAVKVPAK